ncbi:M20 family metallopeptidase [Actinocorallia sp. A-T 12471]|uniref:M20 metallopeptidase family protein n=1 Tax=Actinocorallia sp. A-T 12471 TaxID=3089813 RepID=UPI0029D3BC2D|nr:M20 family metallopeptidase [Actinocorallia sp. A-T 12471]MDX6743608.1 M20 family metallopeptidase [Actinocorallia sp. A-T 12471]
MTVTLADASALQDDLVALRRAIHAEPETGLDLPATQDKVLQALRGLPLEITTGRALSSVTAVLHGSRPGPTVLLRADMDALPLTEHTDLEYRSRNPEAMHACGHDLHTAMLAGAAKLLSREDFAGSVILMFQPGEEGFAGAKLMIDEGVLEATWQKPVAAYALHVSSSMLPSGFVVSKGGPIMAAADTVEVTVRGAGGHSSMPHRTRDPIPAACEMVTATQTFVTRSFDVLDPVVVTVGSIHAGAAPNVIPDDATFSATVRSFSTDSGTRVRDGLHRLYQGIAAAHNVEVEIDYRIDYPVTHNNPAEAALLAQTARTLLGENSYLDVPQPLPSSEDFSFILADIPGALAVLGATLPTLNPATAPGNHSAEAQFDDSILSRGAALYTTLALTRLTHP